MAPGKRAEPASGVLRLLDANLNRCREGFRVLEDTARFVYADEALFRRFRQERHRLDQVTRKTYDRLIESRDSAADHGRRIGEAERSNLKDVVAANFRRCEESLRVLEEYGKILPGGAAPEFKKARFRLYILEKQVRQRKAR